MRVTQRICYVSDEVKQALQPQPRHMSGGLATRTARTSRTAGLDKKQVSRHGRPLSKSVYSTLLLLKSKTQYKLKSDHKDVQRTFVSEAREIP